MYFSYSYHFYYDEYSLEKRRVMEIRRLRMIVAVDAVVNVNLSGVVVQGGGV
jgi:hypothetical protein